MEIIDCSRKTAADEFGHMFFEKIKVADDSFDKIIVLCIGTDRATGDSLGPIIGYKLTAQRGFKRKIRVFGTLESPVHANNLSAVISGIHKVYKNPFIVAIDASLGKEEHVGFSTIEVGTIKPGIGVNKTLPEVGNVAITGIVNVSSGDGFRLLQNTRLGVVMKMADVISKGIYSGLKLYYENCS